MSRILPILFNTEMVQAILDNRKTVTRRIIKPSYRPDESGFQVLTNMGTKERWAEKIDEEEMRFDPPRYVIPPFQPDCIMYVRETWAFQCCIECMNIYEDDSCMIGKTSTIHEDKDAISEGCYIYRADHPHPERIIWRPSIHMPKEAARIWLSVTDIKIQRLQEMTLDDFLQEGVVMLPEAFNDPENVYQQGRTDFIDIWDSTIPKGQQALYGWAANPWIWAIEYERCEKPEPCILKGIAPAEDKRPCIGYQKSKEDDEPCEMCKGCKWCDGEKPESEG